MALNSRYGIVVREMRQDRNLTINYVASGIMSVSGLSRFERGEVMTTLENLVKLLNRMNINMTEYLYRVNRHLWTPSIVFFRELTNALRAGNRARIKELAQSEKEKIVAADDPNDQYRLNTVVAAAALAILDGPDPSSDDIKLVTDYLFNTEDWLQYELHLVGFILTYLDAKQLMRISQSIFRRASEYLKMVDNAQSAAEVELNILVLLLHKRLLDEAEILIRRLDESRLTTRISSELFNFSSLVAVYHQLRQSSPSITDANKEFAADDAVMRSHNLVGDADGLKHQREIIIAGD